MPDKLVEYKLIPKSNGFFSLVDQNDNEKILVGFTDRGNIQSIRILDYDANFVAQINIDSCGEVASYLIESQNYAVNTNLSLYDEELILYRSEKIGTIQREEKVFPNTFVSDRVVP
jgi:hypothetical protein